MQNAFEFYERKFGGDGEPQSGFYLETGGIITGGGWISAGPGYRHYFANRRVLADASAAISWRAYKMAQATLEVIDVGRPGLTFGSQAVFQDLMQVTYFGSGTETREEDRSEYRLRSADVLGFASFKPKPWLNVEGRIGIVNPSLSEPAGPFHGNHPDARLRFPDDPGMTMFGLPSFAYGGVSVVADTRDHVGYPKTGSVYRAAWTHFADQKLGTFSLDRYELEAAKFLPILDGLSTIAVHGWTVLTPSSQNVPFYLQPSMGGDSTLRGYLNYRFHERNMLVVNAESRWALTEHVDGALFVEAGDVTARAADLGIARKTFGLGVRLHARKTTLLRVDLAHGREGWHFLVRTSDPFRLKRLTRRHAPMPFVP